MKLITLTDFDEVIKNDKKIKKAFNRVMRFEKWLSFQGEELRKMINKKADG